MFNNRHSVLKKNTIKKIYMCGFIHFSQKENFTVLEFENKSHVLYIVTTVKLDFGTTFVLSGYLSQNNKLWNLESAVTTASYLSRWIERTHWIRAPEKSSGTVSVTDLKRTHTHTDSCSYFCRYHFYYRRNTHNFSDDAFLTRPPTLQLSWKLPFKGLFLELLINIWHCHSTFSILLCSHLYMFVYWED